MQQQYICLNTSKNIDEIEKTVKQLGMEVILKSKYASIDVHDLTNEERSAWVDSLEMELDRILESLPRFSKTLEYVAKSGKKYADEIRALLKQYSENPRKELLDKINMLNTIAFEELKDHRGLSPEASTMMRYIAYPTIGVSSSVSVSCMIAKKGESVVRYISILHNNDPIVTIMGPDAQTLKQALEGNL